ncbi:MAG: transposase [Planctomycetaceae bacterium]
MRIGESYWSDAPERRDQIVLFPTRLDEVVGGSHCVRLLDEILSQLDWSNWEKSYVLHRGQPPIHPRVMASILLYGLMKGVRSSRALEESLSFRLDFRWLAEGRSIDHTTLSKFRQAHTVALRDLFIKWVWSLARCSYYLWNNWPLMGHGCVPIIVAVRRILPSS